MSLQIRTRDGKIVPFDLEQVRVRLDQIVRERQLFTQPVLVDGVQLTGWGESPPIMDYANREISRLNVSVIDTATIDKIVVNGCIDEANKIADYAILGRILAATNAQRSRARIQPLTIGGYVAGMCSNHNPYAARVRVEPLDENDESEALDGIEAGNDAVLSWLHERTTRAFNDLEEQGFAIDYSYDLTIPAEGQITLEKQYLQPTLILDGHEYKRRPFELPAEMYLRMAIQLAPNTNPTREEIEVNYHYLSRRLCTMSTPVITRGGKKAKSLAACYLTFTNDDSIDDDYETLKRTALNSGGGGGIAVTMDVIRERGGYIRSTGGEAQGLLQTMAPFAAAARHVTQGQRKGSYAIYTSDYHPELIEFAETRMETTPGIKHHELFVGVMLSDLLIKRSVIGGNWTFFPPLLVPKLPGLWGEAYDKQYRIYEKYYKGHPLVKTMKARDLLARIQAAKIATGMPYLIGRTYVYQFSNQRHMMTIMPDGRIMLNLCTEVALFVAPHETAVCILGTVVVPLCVHYRGASPQAPRGCRPPSDPPVAQGNDDTSLGSCRSADPAVAQNSGDRKASSLLREASSDWRPISPSDMPDATPIESWKFDLGDGRIVNGSQPLFDYSPVTPLVTPLFINRYHPDLAAGGVTGGLPPWLETRYIYGGCGSYIDLLELGYSAYQQSIMLNNIFEHNNYAESGASTNSLRERAIGIGQQGLADALTLLMTPLDSPRGRHLNRVIQGVIYFFALLASADIARAQGHTYDTYTCEKHRHNPPVRSGISCARCSPTAHGKLQFDLRNDYINERLATIERDKRPGETVTNNRWMQDLVPIEPITEVNWVRLKAYIAQYGLANAVSSSIQPTETSAKISCISEMCEPRRGVKFTIVNEKQTTVIRHPLLTRLCNVLAASGVAIDIVAINAWLDDKGGSLVGCPDFPPALQKLFRGAFEYSYETLLDLVADREAYIDMSQSNNIYLPEPSVADAMKALYYAYRKMIKTYCYYTRVPASTTLRATQQNSGLTSASLAAPTTCESCST